MIRPIIQHPDARLLEPSKPWSLIEPDPDLIRDLIDTRIHADGAGLSAVQIGVHVRVASMKPDLFYGFSIVINPQIIARGGNTTPAEEGCLSIGNGVPRFQVRRWATVTVKFFDRNGGERILEKCRGFSGRLIQHEIDHMDGKLIV